MTRTEFSQWLCYHGTRFPDAADWLEARGSETRAAWYDTLGRYELAELKAATQALHRGEIEAYGIGNHPPALARYAYQQRQRNASLSTADPEVARDYQAGAWSRQRSGGWRGMDVLREVELQIEQEFPGADKYDLATAEDRQRRAGEIARELMEGLA